MSTKQTEALKLALEALKEMQAMANFECWNLDICDEAITAIQSALAEQPAQEPVAIEYWLQDTMESGRWVTTDNMAKATAEKMLSGEYGDVYPQGRIVEPSPPASKPWVGLTTADLDEIDAPIRERGSATIAEIYRAIEAKLKEKNA